jgi:hypothetical protein
VGKPPMAGTTWEFLVETEVKKENEKNVQDYMDNFVELNHTLVG